MSDSLFFLLTCNGETQGFSFSRSQSNLLFAVRERVNELLGVGNDEKVTLAWKDIFSSTRQLLETEMDLTGVILYLDNFKKQRRNIRARDMPTCIDLEVVSIDVVEKEDDSASDCSTTYTPSEYAWGEESDRDDDVLSICSIAYEPSEYAWGDDVDSSDLELMREKIDDDAVSIGSIEYKESEYAWGDESDMDMNALKPMREIIDVDAVSDCSITYKPSEYAWGDDSDDDAVSECSTAIEPSDVANFEDLRNELTDTFADAAQSNEQIHCTHCNELITKEYVRCPSNSAHKYCFACAWAYLAPRDIALPFYCPSGEKCASGNSDLPWEFSNAEAFWLYKYHDDQYRDTDSLDYLDDDLEVMRERIDGDAVSDCLTAYEPSEYAWGEKSDLEKKEEKLEDDAVSECSTEYKPSEYAWGDDVELKGDGVEDDAVSVGSICTPPSDLSDSDYEDALSDFSSADDDFDLKEAFMNAAASIKSDLSAAADAVDNWLQTDAKVALKGAANKVEGKLQAAAAAARNGLNELFQQLQQRDSAADKKEKKCEECPKLEKRIDQLEEKINHQSMVVDVLAECLEALEKS